MSYEARQLPLGETDAGETPAKGLVGSPHKSSNRKRLVIIGGAVIVITAIATIIYWLHQRQFEGTNDAFVDSDIVMLAPQISGRIKNNPVAANTHVQTGEILVTIDPADAEAELELRIAQAARASAQLDQAKAQVEQANAQLNVLIAAAEGPAALKRKAQADQRRYLNLKNDDPETVPDIKIDAINAAAADAESAASAADRRIASARDNVKIAKSGVAIAAAAKSAADAEVRIAQLQLEYTKVAAPIDGTVVQKNVNIGSLVSPQSALMAIVPDAIFITANYKETQLARIRIGQSVDIKVDAYPDAKFEGRVISIQAGAGQAFQLLPPQNATGNFVKVVQRVPVRISLENPDPEKYVLGPGMSVQPRIRVK